MADWRVKPHIDFEALDAMFAAYNRSTEPGVAVGVAIHGAAVFSRGFGLANLEAGNALSTSTRMRIASISKQFSCLAMLLLIEEGRAQLDDPVRRYLPEIDHIAPGPTIHDLISHTSGLPDACDPVLHPEAGRASGSDILNFYSGTQASCHPGDQWLYNDGAYHLLGIAIERIAGTPLPDVFSAQIFGPIGMFDTALYRWDEQVAPNSATPYVHQQSDNSFCKGYRFSEGGGQGGTHSTIGDMLRWLRHMERPIVGNDRVWERMSEVISLPSGASARFGMGTFKTVYRGIPTVWHAGGQLGTTSQMVKVPAAGIDIIVITNRGDVDATILAETIIDHCVDGLAPVPRPSPQISGTFCSPTTGRLLRVAIDADRQLATIDGKPRRLRWEGGHRFSTAGHLNYCFAFSGPTLEPTAVALDDFGAQDELQRVNKPPSAQRREAFGGRYSSPDGNLSVTIQNAAGSTSMLIESIFGRRHVILDLETDLHWTISSSDNVPALGVVRLQHDRLELRTPSNAPILMRATS